MGDELWISPHTGIRRKGSTFKEMQAVFIDNVTIELIYEPIYSCYSSDVSNNVKKAMDRRGFDVVGVANNQEEIIGFVAREKLKEGIIEDFMQVIEKDFVISVNTPISKLFSILHTRHFSFVSSNGKVEGIVTRADVNKPIVRIYLFGIISLFELHLNFWINQFHSNDSWKNILKNKRLEEAEKNFTKRKGNNDNLSLLECLQFCDKKAILKSTDEFMADFEFSKSNFEDFLSHAEKIRNELFHSQFSIISNVTWPKLEETISLMESFLTKSERKVEERISLALKPTPPPSQIIKEGHDPRPKPRSTK